MKGALSHLIIFSFYLHLDRREANLMNYSDGVKISSHHETSERDIYKKKLIKKININVASSLWRQG